MTQEHPRHWADEKAPKPFGNANSFGGSRSPRRGGGFEQDATVILLWSGTRELLREVFEICGKVRWVHSRAAGLDNLLFPELVESQILLTNE